MSDITIDTPWGRAGQELTGDQIEIFLKDTLKNNASRISECESGLLSMHEKINKAYGNVHVNELDDLINVEALSRPEQNSTGIFNVLDEAGVYVGKLMMFSDNAHHTIVQYLISFYSPETPPEGNAHKKIVTPMYRCWSTDNVHGPIASWSEWRSVFTENFTDLLEGGSVVLTNDIEQLMGDKTNRPMSQRAVTDIINSLCDYLGLTISDQTNDAVVVSGKLPTDKINIQNIVVREMGFNNEQIMSQRAVTTLVKSLAAYLGLAIEQNENYTYTISGTIRPDLINS